MNVFQQLRQLRRQVLFLLLNLLASMILFIHFLTHEQQFIYILLPIIDLILEIMSIMMLTRFKIIENYFVIAIFIISMIIQIELQVISYEDNAEFVFFFTFKLTSFIMALDQPVYQRLALGACIYLFIRLQLYVSVIPYIGLLYLPCIFKAIQKTSNESKLLLFLQEILEEPFLVMDCNTCQIKFQSKTLQEEYDVNQDFGRDLMCFQSQLNQKTINKVGVVDPKKSDFELLACELLEECLFIDGSNSTKKTKILHLEDEIHEHILSEQQTPKHNKLNATSKNSQFKVIRIPLKLRKLNILVQQCFWNGELCYALTLKTAEVCTSSQLQQEIDKLKNLDQNKNQLLATVVHDFKTPINGMLTIVESLLEKSEDKQNIYYLNIIKKNIILLLYMINDILDYARIQRDQLSLCLSDFYINEVVEEVIELITIQAEQKGVEIITAYDIPDFKIHSDPNRIKQVLMNLISNSLKFTEQGSIKIEVTCSDGDKTANIQRGSSNRSLFQGQPRSVSSIGQIRKQLSGKSIMSLSNHQKSYKVTVSDTGCGISEDIKPKLFQMFATFSSKEKPNPYGTGVGLLVCKKLVTLLGPSSEIDIESEPLKGTKMSFRIFARIQEKDRNYSPNYISVFKQEDCQSQLAESASSKYVQSSQIRLFAKQINEIAEISQEDPERSKRRNTKLLLPKSQFFNLKKDDSLDIDDPKYKINRCFHGRSIDIMVVDDQPFNVMAFKLLLQDFSCFRIVEAFHGQQAINRLHEADIQYIFMDLNMPITNGWEATKQIRLLEEVLKPLYIIALTGFDDPQEQERCEQNGFDAFITKPVRIEILAEIFCRLSRN